MSIHRSGPTPPFFEYITSNALIPYNTTPSQTTINLVTGQFQWVEIPRYQRGISWEVENVEEFLYSKSNLLGNVILAQFSRNANNFPFLPQEYSNYSVLVDGLQRFSVGTMLLAILHDLVLTPLNPIFPNDAINFAGLAARIVSLAPIYLHNDEVFQNHPRKAIADQYKRLRQSLETHIKELLRSSNSLEFSRGIVNTFLNRQIAVDIYFNFSGPLELMSTFLGINTVRVDLGPIDLVRAYIVEKGTSSNWSAVEIEDVENEFTGVFTTKNKPDTELLPFVNVILKIIAENNSHRVFPSWRGNLDKKEVDKFLNFVAAYKNLHSNPYINEISECGSIPVAIILAYYYVRHVHHGQALPEFLTGNNQESAELQRFLIACYRGLLEGKLARTRVVAEDIMGGQNTSSLSDIANLLSVQFVGQDIEQKLDKQWLLTVLNRVDKNKSKRVFNAMLLPLKEEGYGHQEFRPLSFGRAAYDFHVDHLIPEGMSTPNSSGIDEINTLRNFAPLSANQNSAAKATNCATKLALNGMYDNYLSSTTHEKHPYCQWLVKTHALLFSSNDLNRQELLEPNRRPDIGSNRINYIAEVLLERV
ncbi:DUF262 domain-containing protein [Paenibacillus sp. NPDC058177]|uniref:GmrSD restriction endonuclease domain-containing protein n=1 Tax=Paenibacillus sp. NPDC058177 TaxID=3346369 RepID=UPI0036DC9D8C